MWAENVSRPLKISVQLFWEGEFSTLLLGKKTQKTNYLRIIDGSANIEYHLIATYTENSYIEYLKTYFT